MGPGLEAVEPSPPGRYSRPHDTAPARPAPPSATSADAQHPGDAGSPPADSQIAALWAIAAAIERLADAVDRLGNPLHDKGTH